MALNLLQELSAKFPDIKPVPMQGGGQAQPWTMAIYGASAEVELQELLYALVRQLRPEVVVELGCHLGLTSYALGRACQDNGAGRVYACDIEPEYTKATYERTLGLPVDVELCSAGCFPYVERADFLFIDCDYENRIGAIARIKPGATAIMHDTRQEPTLRNALDDSGVRRLHFPTWRGFSIFQKS
jgi:predicted O-methyltransferase YrrM